MKVTVMRIDDRLIHGQIVTRWIDYAEAKKFWWWMIRRLPIPCSKCC